MMLPEHFIHEEVIDWDLSTYMTAAVKYEFLLYNSYTILVD